MRAIRLVRESSSACAMADGKSLRFPAGWHFSQSTPHARVLHSTQTTDSWPRAGSRRPARECARSRTCTAQTVWCPDEAALEERAPAFHTFLADLEWTLDGDLARSAVIAACVGRISESHPCEEKMVGIEPKTYIALSVVMFLEFAVWGAWAPVLAARLLGPLKMTGKQTGWIYATLPLACIVSPLVAGQLADQYVSNRVDPGRRRTCRRRAAVRRRPNRTVQPLFVMMLCTRCAMPPRCRWSTRCCSRAQRTSTAAKLATQG